MTEVIEETIYHACQGTRLVYGSEKITVLMLDWDVYVAERDGKIVKDFDDPSKPKTWNTREDALKWARVKVSSRDVRVERVGECPHYVEYDVTDVPGNKTIRLYAYLAQIGTYGYRIPARNGRHNEVDFFVCARGLTAAAKQAIRYYDKDLESVE